ncbi:MAG: hypothetical protein ISR51_07425 [Rhodospirillales bacterium]|nr:hypothetical protein [Alphaproteobacteria bacterium]MBL6948492.1 hypothetical protein [Rhodospirillales bacterium]
MARLGVITGLASEAGCLDIFPEGERPEVRCAGADSDRAHALAQALIGEGCQALLSFGTAGGLTPDIQTGDVICASSVSAPGGQVFETSKAWLEQVQDVLGQDIRVAAMAGADTAIATPEAKKELGQATHSAAVDMESHAVAAAARDAGVDFLVIRAIADPANRAIPPWVLGNISKQGTPRYGPILAGLTVHPLDLPALLRLKGDSDRALRSLRGVAGRLGPLFGLP